MRGHHSYKDTFLVQKGWPPKKEGFHCIQRRSEKSLP